MPRTVIDIRGRTWRVDRMVRIDQVSLYWGHLADARPSRRREGQPRLVLTQRLAYALGLPRHRIAHAWARHGSNAPDPHLVRAALALFAAHLPAREVAQHLRISMATALRWRRRYGDPARHWQGSALLSVDQVAELRALLSTPIARSWTAATIRAEIECRWGVTYTPGGVYGLLRRLGVR